MILLLALATVACGFLLLTFALSRYSAIACAVLGPTLILIGLLSWLRP